MATFTFKASSTAERKYEKRERKIIYATVRAGACKL